MSTKISEIGKVNVIENLFKGSGYFNNQMLQISKKGEFCNIQKMFSESIDFDLVYYPLKHLGYKLAISVIGEIYAKLYNPYSLSFRLSLSSKFSYENLRDFWHGVLAAAKEHKIEKLSLDLLPSMNGMNVAISGCGIQKSSILKQKIPCKSMDLLCVSGDLGAAFMGFNVLEREKVAYLELSKVKKAKQPDLSKYKSIVGEYLSPTIDSDILSRFLEDNIIPSYGCFVSKGLGDAVKTIAKDTAKGVKVYLSKIPINSQALDMANELNLDIITAAMNGGEDYRILFVIPIEKHELFRRNFGDFDIIGHLAQEEVGEVVVTSEGAEIPIKAQGWEADPDSNIDLVDDDCEKKN
ncbi:MAG: hypothetical protein WC140_03265 [Bacteroidales bacterium]